MIFTSLQAYVNPLDIKSDTQLPVREGVPVTVAIVEDDMPAVASAGFAQLAGIPFAVFVQDEHRATDGRDSSLSPPAHRAILTPLVATNPPRALRCLAVSVVCRTNSIHRDLPMKHAATSRDETEMAPDRARSHETLACRSAEFPI
eukprot:753947-Hanusia_phi.AAC.7